jgi:homoserine O-acetyltransferase
MLRTATWIFLAAAALPAQDGQQRFANLGDFRLESGETIHDCRIGYRTWGKPNAARSNAILFPTWFSGTTEQLSGNFGRGKMLDPADWFIVAVDAIGNGVSTSPSNSATQPHMKFPRFTIRDMVESQHRLLTGPLGLTHLRAVMGISMGGMQTFQWMVAYPDFLDRAIPIVGTPRLTPYDTLLWEAERHAIEADAAWKNGDYAQRPAAAMRTVSDIHELALSTPAHYVEQYRGKEMRAVLAADEKATLDGMDTNDWYRQLEAMLGHDIFRAFQGDTATRGRRSESTCDCDCRRAGPHGESVARTRFRPGTQGDDSGIIRRLRAPRSGLRSSQGECGGRLRAEVNCGVRPFRFVPAPGRPASRSFQARPSERS